VRLPTRLALVGVATLAATLAAVALLTYQLVGVSGRQDVDATLERELSGLVAGLTEDVPEGGRTTAALQEAAARSLALNPGSDRHLAVIEVAGRRARNLEGAAALVRLERDGRLPAGEVGRLTTVGTPAGDVRVLAAAIEADGVRVGTATIVGTLDDARDAASTALTRIALAGAIGLVLGGAALTLATRRALAPVVGLAGAARATKGDDVGARVPETGRSDEIGELAREFNRMLDRIAADAEDRRRLLSAVSHELRTPLAVARGHLEVFEAQGAGDAAVAELAGVVRTELDRLALVVGDLTAVASGEEGYGIDAGPVFVPDVLDDLRERVAGLGLAGVEVAPGAPVVVAVDQGRVAQSLLNLVVNATTHNPAGTSVAVSAEADGDAVTFTVRDDGPGIDASVRDRAFEPFVTSRAGGAARLSGLGLAVVKSLTEAQGGTVRLDTGPGGTAVALTFPQLG
jgi:signal transduction histidine kinase